MKGWLTFILDNWLLIPLAIVSFLFVNEMRQVWDLKLELSDTQRAYAEERQAAERAARVYDIKVAKVKDQHAIDQQDKEDRYVQRETILASERDAAVRNAGRLRDQLAAATRRETNGTEADPAACRADQARLESLGQLAGEGVELLEEGRQLLGTTELQLDRAIEQITIDRKAVSELAKE